jgi:hypothetical protein
MWRQALREKFDPAKLVETIGPERAAEVSSKLEVSKRETWVDY